MKDQQKKLFDALAELNDAAASSRILIYGRPAKDRRLKSNKPREVIPAHYIDEIRLIDGWGCLSCQRFDLDYALETDDGPFFADIATDAIDVQKLWPKTTTHSALPALNGQSFRMDTIEYNQNGGRERKRTGPRPDKTTRVVNTMLEELRSNSQTPDSLNQIKFEALALTYDVSKNGEF